MVKVDGSVNNPYQDDKFLNDKYQKSLPHLRFLNTKVTTRERFTTFTSALIKSYPLFDISIQLLNYVFKMHNEKSSYIYRIDL